MSEVSKKDGVGPVQPAPSPFVSWVTIKSAPGASTADGQPAYVQVSRCTAMLLTVIADGELFTMRMAPASYVQAETGTQPSKMVFGDPAQGVGKFVASARKLSA